MFIMSVIHLNFGKMIITKVVLSEEHSVDIYRSAKFVNSVRL